ncbi:MAG: hypothetical protein AAGD05_19235, partial [Bacteroidota bacterium]
DLHPANILIDKYDVINQEVSAFICDFDRTRKDYANSIPPTYLHLDGQELCATERNRPSDKLSPEQLNEYHGLPACDIYSLASMLCIAVLGREIKDHGLRFRVLSGQSDWPKPLMKLLTDSMDINPTLRPSASEFIKRLEAIRWITKKEKRRRSLLRAIINVLLVIVVVGLTFNSVNDRYSPDPDCEDFTCLEEEITEDFHLKSGTDYLINRPIFVKSGTLKIDAGTRIYGKEGAFLVIGPDAKIDANGVEGNPIVFTSWHARSKSKQVPEAGDWGGVALLGKAPVLGKDKNLEFCSWINNEEDVRCNFGGEDPHHSSGVFRFVRIEYAGNIMDDNEEVNGLTLAGVGDGTLIEYVMVSDVIDDCFEFFGGTVRAQYLICRNPEDDAFDYEKGYCGELSHLFMVGGPSPNRKHHKEEG